MKWLYVTLLILSSLNIYAQQDGYFDGFCLAFGKFEISFLKYREHKMQEDTGGHIYTALVDMTQQYHTMLKMYDEASFKYRHNAGFDTMSRPHYLQVMDATEVMLENDLTLRKMKQMVQTLISLEREGFPRQYDEVNNALGRLHFFSYYSGGSFDRTMEGYLVRKQLQALEAYVFRRYFEPVIEKLSVLQDHSLAMDFKQLTENTHCEPCREKAVQALLNFYERSLHHL